MSKYIVVDVANLFYRCKNVVQGDPYTKAGMATHIVFRSIKKVFRDRKADHVVLCLEAKSWRETAYPQYKVGRKVRAKMSELTPREQEENQAFRDMFQELMTFLTTKTNISVLQADGAEGDDCMARWVQIHPDDEHVLITGDSDVYQLLSDTVDIYDGVRDILITTKGVFDYQNRPVIFSLKTDGKLKIGKAITKKDPPFTPEAEWWKRALFMKCMRGDSGDSISSAYPRVREPKLIAAWEDRHTQGYNWNNLMLQTWKDKTDDGQDVEYVVRDVYARNQGLIDLTKQPDDVIANMDESIINAVQAEPRMQIGIQFMKFCGKFDLKQLANEASLHSEYLSARYIKPE